jgi:hypothetical protein
MRREQPIGDVLVSYSAAELPTDYLDGVRREVRDEVLHGERNAASALQIFDLLIQIAIQKLRTVET